MYYFSRVWILILFHISKFKAKLFVVLSNILNFEIIWRYWSFDTFLNSKLRHLIPYFAKPLSILWLKNRWDYWKSLISYQHIPFMFLILAIETDISILVFLYLDILLTNFTHNINKHYAIVQTALGLKP